MRAPECGRIGLEKSGNAAGKGRPIRPCVGNSRPGRCKRPRIGPLHLPPKLIELSEAILRCVSCNDAGVDGTDRGANDPIRFDARLVQRLVYTDLVGAERSTALEDEHHLSLGIRAKFIDCISNHCLRRAIHRGLPHICKRAVARGKQLRQFQCAVQPPSTGSPMPVIEPAASEERKTDSAPSSSTVAKRLLGCCASSTSRITFSRGMLCALAWPSICASTRGV